ncbi:MAG: sigma-54 dependent transcriptional regulator [Gammaproteobacteria bacterium]|nr:MAG: sigma-54 dependent transcriptional regulator [Gammaproteobacteria bacterium]
MSRGEILVVDDEPDIRRLVQEILEDENYDVITAENAAAARTSVSQSHPDLVLLDIWMPDVDGISLLKEWSSSGHLDAPVVMMSGHGNIETAVEATRLGAYDYIEKPLSMSKLLVTIDRALQSSKLRQENLRLKNRIEPVSVLTGRTPVMVELRETIDHIATTDAWILITGEAGCGKTVAARYLHSQSTRKDKPFIEISPAAIPAQDILAHLFGRESSDDIILGSFERAAGGTLLLNEIGDLDMDVQSKLLHALEEKRFQRVGGAQVIDLNVRVVTTSNQSLKLAISQGNFREDLFYRLNVVPLHIPPLREHREDVLELVNYYVDWLTDNEHLPYRRFSTGALNLLRNYTWPGNTRELKNLVQRLLILNTGPEISGAEVDRSLNLQPPGEKPGEETGPGELFHMPLREAREAFEKAYLEHQLKQTSGNVSQAAEKIGMERTHLYRKLKQLGVNPKQHK